MELYGNEFTQDELDYIEDMAAEYGMDYDLALMLADMMPTELYDGFVMELEDYEDWGW